MREYKSLQVLNSGQILDLEGIKLKKAEGDLKPGDLYVAERNTGPKLLTVLNIKMSENGNYPDWVVPTTLNYCYDWHECIKVESVD